MKQIRDHMRCRESAPLSIPTMLALVTTATCWSTPTFAIIARACVKKSGFDTIWDMGIGPFLYLALTVATVLWLKEESKGQNASARTLATVISGTAVLAMIMITLARLESDHDAGREYVFVLSAIICACLLKILFLFQSPRLGRAIPAMVLIYVALIMMLTPTVRTICERGAF